MARSVNWSYSPHLPEEKCAKITGKPWTQLRSGDSSLHPVIRDEPKTARLRQPPESSPSAANTASAEALRRPL